MRFDHRTPERILFFEEQRVIICYRVPITHGYSGLSFAVAVWYSCNRKILNYLFIFLVARKEIESSRRFFGSGLWVQPSITTSPISSQCGLKIGWDYTKSDWHLCYRTHRLLYLLVVNNLSTSSWMSANSTAFFKEWLFSYHNETTRFLFLPRPCGPFISAKRLGANSNQTMSVLRTFMTPCCSEEPRI